MSCINTNHPDFIKLKEETGLSSMLLSMKISEYMKENNTDEFPSKEILIKENEVNYTLKAINILQSDKAKQVFDKGRKNLWSLDKILTELAVPKEQKELIKQIEQDFVQKQFAIYNEPLQYALELAANYSYTVEINTTKESTFKQKPSGFREESEDKVQSYTDSKGNTKWQVINTEIGIIESDFNTKEDALAFIGADITGKKPTQYYSNLTAPGGTNYTEKEISTPLITPSIKGHAQFSTDNGIGWFRSDEQAINQVTHGKLTDSGFSVGAYTYYRKNEKYYKSLTTADIPEVTELSKEQYEKDFKSRDDLRNELKTDSKTRRILEVQSDLFQKGRDKNDLIGGIIEEGVFNPETGEWDTPKDWGKEILSNEKQNQFLQLLNKDNNWVTFFIKSIIQDSAKKGYEKVLFPTGNTASKVESHTTLEEFKKQKESRIVELENQKKEKAENIIGFIDFINQKGYTSNIEEGRIAFKKENNTKIDIEINQLKQELERVETEGFGALKPIFKFYEETVTNILINQIYGRDSEFVNYEFTFNGDKYERLNDKNQYLKNSKEITQKEFNSVQNSVTKQDKKDGKFKDKYYVNSNAFITDEYGNTWNEIEIKSEHNNTILFQNTAPQEQLKEFNESTKERFNTKGTTAKQMADFYGLTKKYDGLEFYKVNHSDGTSTLSAKIKNGSLLQQLEKNTNLPQNREVNIVLKNLLAKIGVTLEEVDDNLTINGEKVSGVAYADLFRKVIQYVNGKIDGTTLPEEVAHVFTLLMKKNDPLREAMIRNVKSLEIYHKIRNDAGYQIKYGDNEDLYIIEAIGKVIMQRIMNIPVAKKEMWVQTWWNNLVNYIKGIFGVEVTNELEELLKPFDGVKNKMLAEDINGLMSLDEFAEENNNKQFQLYQLDDNVNPVEATINKLSEFTEIGNGKVVNKEGKEFDFVTTSEAINVKLKHDVINQLMALRGLQSEPLSISEEKLKLVNQLAENLNNEIINTYGDDVKLITNQLYHDFDNNVVRKADLLLVLPDGSVDIKFIQAINENKKYGVNVSHYTKFDKKLQAIKKYLNKVGIKSRSIKIAPIKVELSKKLNDNNKLASFDLGNSSFYIERNRKFYKDGVEIPKQEFDTAKDNPESVDTTYNIDYNNPQQIGDNEEFSEFSTVNESNTTEKDERNKINELVKVLRYRLEGIENSNLPYEIKSQSKKKVLIAISQLLVKDSYVSAINAIKNDLITISKEFTDMSPIDLRNAKDFADFATRLESKFKLKEKIKEDDNLDEETKKELLAVLAYIREYSNNLIDKINNHIKLENLKTGNTVEISLESDSGVITGVNELDVAERNKAVASSNLDFLLSASDASVKYMRQLTSSNKWIGVFVNLLDKQQDTILNSVDAFADKMNEFKAKIGDRVDTIFNKKTGNLIARFTKEYHEKARIARTKKDWKWFEQNSTIKNEARILYDAMLAKEIERLDGLKLEEEVFNYKVDKFRQKYDIFSDVYRRTAYLDSYTRSLFLNISDTWESTEYKNLDSDLKEFYDFWASTMNNAANVLGEKDKIKSNTVPPILKSLVESAFSDGKFDMSLMFAGLKFTGESRGKENPITSKIEYSIPKYFIEDILDSEGKKNLNNKSADLFKVLTMFQAMVINYEKKSEIEGQVFSLLAGMANEEVLKKIEDRWVATKENERNVETFTKFINWAMYDVNNIDNDTRLGINKNLSTQKTIAALKNYSVKTNLALNSLSIAANFLGNQYNILIESAKGIAFNNKGWYKSAIIYNNIFDRSEALGFLELLDLDKQNRVRKKVNGLSLSSVVKRYENSNALFIQHFSENAIRNRVAIAMALNHTINDTGKIVRITDEANQKNLIDLGVINGKDNYDLDVSNDELSKFKKRVQHEIGIITGFTSENDTNTLKLYTIGNLISTYRGWIPKMLETRWGNTQYNTTIDQWVTGRYRTFVADLVNSRFKNLLANVVDALPFVTTLKGNSYEESLRQRAKIHFIQKMQSNPKLTLENEEEFIDNYVANMKANKREIQIIMGLMLAYLAIGGFDDDKNKKNKFLTKLIWRSYNELSFFDDPRSFSTLLKSPIPGTNFILNNVDLLFDVWGEIKGNVTGDVKLVKDSKPLNRIIKNIPYVSGIKNTATAVFGEDK